MKVSYLNDEDLVFLQHCSEEQLANFALLLTHNEKGKRRLSSTLLHNELYMSMDGHPEQHRRNWQLIAGEFQHFGGDSIANQIRGHGKLYREILRDVAKRLGLKTDKAMPTPAIEKLLLEQFVRSAWKRMSDEQKVRFHTAVELKVMELEALLPHLIDHHRLDHGIEHLLGDQLSHILHKHAAVSVIGHGLMRGAGLGGPVGAAVNGVKAVSGSAYRVTIPAVLRIACLRRIIARAALQRAG